MYFFQSRLNSPGIRIFESVAWPNTGGVGFLDYQFLSESVHPSLVNLFLFLMTLRHLLVSWRDCHKTVRFVMKPEFGFDTDFVIC